LNRPNPEILWLYLLTGTVLYAKYVVEGVLPDPEATAEAVFKLLTAGIISYLVTE